MSPRGTSSTYDPNPFEEQTIYGEVNRAELEKYFTIPEDADLRAVRRFTLQPDPAETEITQVPVFHWRNGDFTLPDNTIFTGESFRWEPITGSRHRSSAAWQRSGDGYRRPRHVLSFKKGTPGSTSDPGEHDVTVVFTPDDTRLHKPTETTIKINAIKKHHQGHRRTGSHYG